MLHTSQIENPRCSAKIDQIRLRRAINLPLDSQYFSSSGSQFEIQAVRCLLISVVSLRSRSVQIPGFRLGAEETPPGDGAVSGRQVNRGRSHQGPVGPTLRWTPLPSRFEKVNADPSAARTPSPARTHESNRHAKPKPAEFTGYDGKIAAIICAMQHKRSCAAQTRGTGRYPSLANISRAMSTIRRPSFMARRRSNR